MGRRGIKWVPAKIGCQGCKSGTCLDGLGGQKSCQKCRRQHIRCVRKGTLQIPPKTAAAKNNNKRVQEENQYKKRQENFEAENTIKIRKMEQRLRGMENLEMRRAEFAKRQLDYTVKTFVEEEEDGMSTDDELDILEKTPIRQVRKRTSLPSTTKNPPLQERKLASCSKLGTKTEDNGFNDTLVGVLGALRAVIDQTLEKRIKKEGEEGRRHQRAV